MEKINYHRQMLEIIKQNQELNRIPTLLLHTCCAPCSSAVIASLSNSFLITVFYYNPNIEPEVEYFKRKEEQIRFLKEFPSTNPVQFLDCDWDHGAFTGFSKSLANEPEGGRRCLECYKLRLEKTAQVALERHFDYFTTSLTISPYKNAQIMNQIGKSLEERYGIKYLYSDFKKEQGYQKSILFSKEYQLYRQDYCGCAYSFRERQEKKENRSV